MLLMLVVSWPRCLGVSADAADAGRIVASGHVVRASLTFLLYIGVLQHVCLSMFGEKLVCWVKTFSPVAVFVWQCVHMLEQNSSY